MSVLITGANGVVGNEIAKKLSKKFKIIGIYRKKNLRVKKLKNIKWIKFDLKKRFDRNFKSNLKLIIHCAIDQSHLFNSNKKKYVKTNKSIFNNILEYAEKKKVKLFINFSSIDVYGNVNKNYIKENDKFIKQNTYGYTKSLLEKILIKKKLNYVNLRLPGILCDPNNLSKDRPLINSIFYKFKFNRPVSVYGLEKKFNNVISVDEIIKFILFSLKKKKVQGTYNFSSRNPMLFKKILENIRKKTKSRSKIKSIKKNKYKSFCISTQKIEKNLNYKIITTNQEINNYIKKFNNQVK